ncbi:YidH family protein [Rossellomorea sp. FM04394]
MVVSNGRTREVESMNETKESKYIQQHLANERTFLAWIRTAIAIIGIGFLTTSLHYNSLEGGAVQDRIAVAISAISLIIGLVIIIGSTVNYYRTRKHINTQTFVSADAFIKMMAIVATVVLIFVTVYFFTLN